MTRLPAIALLCLASPALADSCWVHEGSLVRLVTAGTYRALLVERPSIALQQAGVEPGTKLFEGVDEDGWLLGSARDLDAACPTSPRLFYAEGLVQDDPLRLNLAGLHEIFEGCQPTGRWTTDVLRLSYSHEC